MEEFEGAEAALGSCCGLVDCVAGLVGVEVGDVETDRDSEWIRSRSLIS